MLRTIVLIVMMCLMYNTIIIAEWTESIYYGSGNLSIKLSFPIGYFHEIPGSTFAAFESENNLLILDLFTGRIRGGRPLSHGFNYRNVSIIPDPVSGWNLFYYNQ